MRCVLCATCLALVHLAAALGFAGQRPNVVFILTDDQGAWTLGVSGNRQSRTPHLDRLARDGAYLKNAFAVTPVCSPSRASTLTSRYGSEFGIHDWIHPQREPELGLDPAAVTWPKLLHSAGYRTGLIGKWHLGTADRFHPTRHGFDHFLGFRHGSLACRNPTLEIAGQDRKVPGFSIDLLTDEAIAFVRRERAGPFLLCLHYHAPHAPWLPLPDQDWKPLATLDPELPGPTDARLDVPAAKRALREYLASVAAVDRNLGRLLAVLDELNLRENTAVIFTSDHGYNVGQHGLLHKGNAQRLLVGDRSARPNLFDTSLRVPAIVRWPRRIKPGTMAEPTHTNLDWLPTILAIAEVPLPAGAKVRGRNYLPLLTGEAPAWDEDLLVQYSLHHGARADLRGYRTPRWKWIRDLSRSQPDELYDLAADPDETRNLAASADPAPRAARGPLNGRLLTRMAEIDDPLTSLARSRSVGE